MNELCSEITLKGLNSKLNRELSQDVDQQTAACAAFANNGTSFANDHSRKKRKRRRGKSKRRQPYLKNSRKSNKLIKPEAPHNNNQFLLEDHGTIEDLDENLKAIDQASTSTLARTRDSSFSAESDEFYSSPDDEEQFLIKDFDDQYESLQAERLQSMSKAELVQEYLQLENRLEQLSKKLQNVDGEEPDATKRDLKQELERLIMENEYLRRENELLRKKINQASDSEDTDSDSSDSCSSSSDSCKSCKSTCSSRSRSPISNVDYDKMNGDIPSVEPV